LAVSDSFVRLYRRLGQDRRGGTALLFAILAPVLLVLVLGVIDLYRLGSIKQQMQESIDNATLIVARSTVKEDVDAEEMGDKAFEALISKDDIGSPLSGFTLGTDEVTGVAEGEINPIIVGVFTGGKLHSRVKSVVKRATGSPLELALVLDTTGSMSGQPLKDLKAAARDLVNELHKDPKAAGLVKIAVVPFGQYVNIGVERRKEPWVSVPDDYSVTKEGWLRETKSQTTCATEKYPCDKNNDGVITTGHTCTRSVEPCIKTTFDPPKQEWVPESTTNYKFHGCVGSPTPHPKNVEDKDENRIYPGFMNLTCGSTFTPLTTDKGAVLQAVNGLKASGLTYIPSGLAWGWNMLSPGKPMVEAQTYDPTGQNARPRKALVLMTDGANTVVLNPANGRHDVAGSAQANTATAELCTNIKGVNIEVFTIAFQVTDQTIKDILGACATDSEHYFDASDAQKLKGAFASIATSLQSLYIAK
jgi:Flp pilus assembly protein TadG